MADRLRAERRQRFVGRQAEQEAFGAMLSGQSAVSVLWLHGVGGVGKSTLLAELVAQARDAGRTVALIDARDVDPTPAAFFAALARGLGLSDTEELPDALARTRMVICIDTYETMGALDAWLRTDFLPSLPEATLLIIAGRDPPGEWRLDPGLSGLVQSHALGNLSTEEGRDLLARRGVREELRAALCTATHGHPLALALVAELPEHLLGRDFSLTSAPDLISTLVDRFVASVPSARHRDALFMCAEALATTEDHLAAAFGEQAAELFDWLRGLSFVERGPHGLFPHDIARQVLSAELRQRGPDAIRPLHRGVRDVLLGRMRTTHDRRAQTRAALELLYLHRHSPAVGWVVDPRYGTVEGEPLRPGDRDQAMALVWGPEFAAIIGRWIDVRPEGVTTYRNPHGELEGVGGLFELDEAGLRQAAAFDPAVRCIVEHVSSHGGLASDELVLLSRFFVHRVIGEGTEPSRTEFQARAVARFLTTPRLAFSFLPLRTRGSANRKLGWHGVLEYGDHTIVPNSLFTVDGFEQDVAAHDWRRMPPDRWLELMEERELGAPPQPSSTSRTARQPDRLEESQLRAAVRTALKGLHRDDVLCESPLLGSRAVRELGGDPVAALRSCVQSASESLRAHPRDAKLLRALDATYLDPAETQELAADRLALPFSTYRRHLGDAIERIADWFWQRERMRP